MRIQLEKRSAHYFWRRKRDWHIHPDILAASFFIHFLLYLIISLLLIINQQVPSSHLAKSFHPIYLLQFIKTGNESLTQMGTRAEPVKKPRPKEKTLPVRVSLVSTSRPPILQSPKRKIIEAKPPPPLPVMKKPLVPIQTNTMTVQIDYQRLKEKEPTPQQQIQEVKNKYEPVLKKEKSAPPKEELRRSWIADSPIPKRKKIVVAQSEVNPGKRELSERMEKKRKRPASTQALASRENSLEQIAMIEKEAFSKNISERDSSHNILLSRKKTPQSPASQSSKTPSIKDETEIKKISTLKREITGEQIKFAPVTARSPHLDKITPSLYPAQEKMPSKSFSILNAENSPQQRSVPVTQTAERKTDLNPSFSEIDPEQVTPSVVKISMQNDNPVPEKGVSVPTNKKMEHDLKTKTYHDNLEKETTLFLPTPEREVRQDRIEVSPSSRRKKNITSQLASVTQEMSTVSAQPSELASTVRKDYIDHTAISERVAFLKKIPEMESSDILSARKTLQSPETVLSSKTPDSRTKIRMEKASSPRKVGDVVGKHAAHLPIVARTPQPKKTISLFDFPRTKDSLKRLSTLSDEKKRQTTNTQITQTAKRISDSRSFSLPFAIDNHPRTGLSTYYQSRSVPPVEKSARNTLPKQELPVEEKKIDKKINYQKDSNTNLAMLTPGEMPKTNMYDVISGSFKKKKLDKKIYDSFIIPNKKDKATLTSFLTNHFLNRNPVKEILVTSKGIIWAGIEGGILKYDGLRWDFFQSAGRLPGKVVYALAEAPDGSFWIGTENGLTQLDQWGNRTLPSTGLNRSVFDIRIDQKGTVWAGTDSGLFRYNGSRWEEVQVPKDISGERVNTIVEDRKGRIWIGTEKGLSVYNGKEWTHFDTADGLIHNNVNSLAVDTRGNLWCGTEKGVSRFNGKRWQSYTKADGLADNMVYTVKADSNGNVWFGTGAGVSKFNNYRFFNYDRKNGLLGWNVHSIAIANNGEYWFGTDRGVSKMLEAN